MGIEQESMKPIPTQYCECGGKMEFRDSLLFLSYPPQRWIYCIRGGCDNKKTISVNSSLIMLKVDG